VTLDQWRKEEGLLDEDEFLNRIQELVIDSMCPVLCEEGCGDVEPDGHCRHGHPSVLIAAGLM